MNLLIGAVTIGLILALLGLGLGAIGRAYAECHEQMGELLAVAGTVATFPGDGARLPDYLLADGPAPPQVVLASGLSCRGTFAKLVRFNTQPEADAVPLSELASVCLDAVGGRLAGVVIAGVNPTYQAGLRKSLPALQHKTIHRV